MDETPVVAAGVAVSRYPGWLLLPDGTYVDASDVIAVQPTEDGVVVYTAGMSFAAPGSTVHDVLAVVAKHRKGGPPVVPPGQAKKPDAPPASKPVTAPGRPTP